jgi:hypothetical protein
MDQTSLQSPPTPEAKRQTDKQSQCAFVLVVDTSLFDMAKFLTLSSSLVLLPDDQVITD